MDISLTGLTEEQKVMLDLLWELDSKEKYIHFMETLSPKSLEMAIVLQEMVMQELAERDSTIPETQAKYMLKSIGVNV